MARTKSPALISQMHDYWINPATRELWIHGVDVSGVDYEGAEPGVEYIMATRVIKNLHFFRKQSSSQPVVAHLHTCGGIWEEGMAIYDTIKLMPYPVTIISYTHARSMSSIILQAADYRLLLPHSYFMFHYGTLETGGHAPTVYSEVAFTQKNDETMLDIYVDKAYGSKHFNRWSKKRIRENLKSFMDKKGDVYLDAEEAVEWGFADEVLDSWPNT